MTDYVEDFEKNSVEFKNSVDKSVETTGLPEPTSRMVEDLGWKAVRELNGRMDTLYWLMAIICATVLVVIFLQAAFALWTLMKKRKLPGAAGPTRIIIQQEGWKPAVSQRTEKKEEKTEKEEEEPPSRNFPSREKTISINFEEKKEKELAMKSVSFESPAQPPPAYSASDASSLARDRKQQLQTGIPPVYPASSLPPAYLLEKTAIQDPSPPDYLSRRVISLQTAVGPAVTSTPVTSPSPIGSI